MMRSWIVLALMAVPAILSAQQPVAGKGYAVISGVAVDSVRGGYLRGAIVSVSGTTLSATTDSMGRFRVDSVPAGARYLEVMHPLLDSMAIKVRTPQRDLKAGDSTTFILSVPSPETIAAAKCTAAERLRGAGVLLGTVNDADTETPSDGALVSVEWTEYQLGRRSMNKIPQRRIGTVRSDGSYKVCGIPDDFATGVVAYRGSDSTAVVPASFSSKVAIVSFHLPPKETVAAMPVPAGVSVAAGARPLADSATRTAHGTATLSGKVIDPSGAPLANARAAIEADDAASVTNNQGEFRLTGLRPGTRSLTVHRIGFASLETPVDVSGTSTRSVTVTMVRYVAMLDAVRVTAMRDIGLQRVGYSDRQRLNSGKFYGPDEISKRNPDKLLALIETAPMLRMATNQDGKRYVTGRHNGCVAYFVDGHSWYSASGNDPEITPDAFLSGAELGAVEVYDDMSAPAEYMRFTNGGSCAVVVIWTKWKLAH